MLIRLPCFNWRQMTAVQSSGLQAVDFDWSATLTIEVHSGGVYEYFNVPPPEFAALMNAGSHGTYFHDCIKNHNNYHRIQ
jgi:hypothetical protein